MKTLDKICVVGLGYIGLPTAATLASTDVNVIGLDVSERAVEAINQGKTHIVEPGLQEVLQDVVSRGKLKATLSPEPADAFLIAVPTPFLDNGSTIPKPDISYIEAAARSIAPVLDEGNIVVLESTSPVGTTEILSDLISELRPDIARSLHFAYSPERVIPGATMRELRTNSRVVGGMTPEATERAVSVYARFVEGEITRTDTRTAEMVKLVENSFRDVNIAFANELSMICSEAGVNVWEVIDLANRHPRVNILRPGAGVGGHCIAVDPWFIVSQHPSTARLIHAARQVNDAKPHVVTERVVQAANGRSGAVVCLGLSFKPDVDDFRESPALEIAHELNQKLPGRVIAVDPFAHALSERQRSDLTVVASLDDVPGDVAVTAALVSHEAFKSMRVPASAIVDACGLWRL